MNNENLFYAARDLYEKSITKTISEEDLDAIISWPPDAVSLLFACADLLKRRFFRDTVDPCSLMNIKSGGCSEDCAFCAQSAHNKARVEIRSLAGREEIIENCRKAQEKNLVFCVVSSGKKLATEEVRHVAAALKECGGEKHASLGVLTAEEFRLLKEAGVTCYNHNLESSRGFYEKIVTTHPFDIRIETVRRAKAAGLSVCCGGIFGMGETWEDRKSLCMELRALDVDTIPINFLNAVPGIRLAAPRETPLEFLKIVSMFRIANPDKTIKVCGGREANLGKLEGLIFTAGANGYITGGYLTTEGAGMESDDLMIAALGFKKKLAGA